MATKQKNRQRKLARKAAKQKIRNEKIKQQKSLTQMALKPTIEDAVDYALQNIEEGNWNQAEKLLKKLKRKHPNHSRVNYGIGVLCAFTDQLDDAITFFKKATQIAPDFVEAYYNMGVAYQNQLNVSKMVSTFRKVTTIGEPDDYVVQQAQEMLKSLQENIEKNEGIDLDKFMKAQDFFDQGVVSMQTKNWEDAIVFFKKALEINKNNPQSYGNIGICYSHIGKKKLSIEALDKALELDPRYEPALVNRAMAESMEDGERLKSEKVKIIDYYKDYPFQKKSYIQELIESKNNLLSEEPEN